MWTSRLVDLDPPRPGASRFDPRAHVFVLEALEAVLQSLDEPRHISPKELAESVRHTALVQFGPMARIVLEFWGIRETADLGRVVLEMVDEGLLVTQDEDRFEDFADAFDFEKAFDEYPFRAQS